VWCSTAPNPRIRPKRPDVEATEARPGCDRTTWFRASKDPRHSALTWALPARMQGRRPNRTLTRLYGCAPSCLHGADDLAGRGRTVPTREASSPAPGPERQRLRHRGARRRHQTPTPPAPSGSKSGNGWLTQAFSSRPVHPGRTLAPTKSPGRGRPPTRARRLPSSSPARGEDIRRLLRRW
jgi:hypothetical protein